MKTIKTEVWLPEHIAIMRRQEQIDKDRLARFLAMPKEKQIAYLKHVFNARRWRGWLSHGAAHEQVAEEFAALDKLDGGCEEWT